MGGKESIKGYMYQSLVAILNALNNEDYWDKLIVEVDSEEEKVDIALEKNNKTIKCIQVKSSINLFNKQNVKSWIEELLNDSIDAKIYELFLIGNCYNNANIFIKSIKKYQEGEIDQEVEKSLKDFERSTLNGKRVNIQTLGVELDQFVKIVKSELHRYMDIPINYEQISSITSMLITDIIKNSTVAGGISRDEFDSTLKKRIKMLVDNYEKDRISIGIQSFSKGAELLKEEVDEYLDLKEKFTGRKLKEGYNWENDIKKEVENFINTKMEKSELYKLRLETHTSIAFATGRALNTKMGISAFPMQKTATEGLTLWEIDSSDNVEYNKFNITEEKCCEESADCVLVINITRNILSNVKEYIDIEQIKVSKIINCVISNSDCTNNSIINGNHASNLANSVYEAIKGRTILEKRGILHIFISAPNSFTFFLGQVSEGFGKCILYEYDFEQANSCSYEKSIKFINGGK